MNNLQLELYHLNTHDNENENSHCLETEERMVMTAMIAEDKDSTVF